MAALETTIQRAGATGNIKATREDWLKLALETLISDGVERVRVLTLGQKLDVSRSSFYWYFKSRQDLLDQLLDYWRQTNTRFIVERAGRPSATVIRGVMSIFECSSQLRQACADTLSKMRWPSGPRNGGFSSPSRSLSSFTQCTVRAIAADHDRAPELRQGGLEAPG